MNMKYVDNDVFQFSVRLNDDTIDVAVYTNPSPKEWDDDYDRNLTLEKKKEMVENSYFTPERIAALKEQMIEKIRKSENPFDIFCRDYDGGYDVTEDRLFKIDWKAKK